MTKLQRGRLFVGVAAFALAAAGLAAAPGAAAEPEKTDKAAAERHCVADVTTGATQCFATFREAIQRATAGRITDADLSAQTATADSKTVAKLNSGERGVAALVIGIQYYWEGFNRFPDGSLRTPAYTLTHSGDNACTTTTTDLDYRKAPLLNGALVNWNNNIRSFQGFNNCWQRMWDNANCTGLLLDYSSSSADLGSARDRTECIDWS